MSKHTPGGWVTGSTDPLLFGRKQGNGTEPIGFIYGPSFPECSDVGRRALADARLCAAAPDLLAVLKELQECSGYWSEYDVPLGIVERINAVISKAEAV